MNTFCQPLGPLLQRGSTDCMQIEPELCSITWTQYQIHVVTTHSVACELALQGTLVVGLEKEGELATTSLELEFHLQIPCGISLTRLSNFCQSAWSGNKQECKKHWKTRAKGNDVIMPISISHQLFRSRYSYSRDVVASSFSFLPHHQSTPGSMLPGYIIQLTPLLPVQHDSKHTVTWPYPH